MGVSGSQFGPETRQAKQVGVERHPGRFSLLGAGLLALALAACGGYDALQPGDLNYDTQTIDFAVQVEDTEGRTHDSSLALETAGCPSTCIPFRGGAARVPLRCLVGASASDNVALRLHDDGGRCQSPVGSCEGPAEQELAGGAPGTLRCVVAPVSITFSVTFN